MRSVSVEILEGDERGTYRSLVLDFAEGKEILIGALLDRGREVPVDPGSPVQLTFAQSDGLHVLSARVIGRSERQPSLRLSWPEQNEHIQRRSHTRVELLVRGELSVDDTELPVLTSNLGAGGVLATLPAALEDDTQVRLRLHLPGLGERTFEALVIRAGETAGAAENHRYWVALEFVGMLQSVRDDLMQYVADIERERARAMAD
jgi:c-di-GMP-binding flagellar brake protein YcgR